MIAQRLGEKSRTSSTTDTVADAVSHRKSTTEQRFQSPGFLVGKPGSGVGRCLGAGKFQGDQGSDSQKMYMNSWLCPKVHSPEIWPLTSEHRKLTRIWGLKRLGKPAMTVAQHEMLVSYQTKDYEE